MCGGKSQLSRRRVDAAFKIYHCCGEKDAFLINKMVKICIDSKQPHKIRLLSDDIEGELQRSAGHNVLDCSSVLKCCALSGDIETSRSIHRRLALPMGYSEAVRSIEALYRQMPQTGGRRNEDAVRRAFTIFASIECSADLPVLGLLLRLCLKGRCPERMLSLWGGLKSRALDGSTRSLVIRCCAGALRAEGDASRIVPILRALHRPVLEDSDVLSKEHLIRAYSLCASQRPAATAEALELFHSIPPALRSAVAVGAMMACSIRSGHDRAALALFDAFSAQRNDITLLLAIRAATNSNDRESGLRIIGSAGDPKGRSLKLIISVVAFHGHFGDVEAAKAAFDGIPQSELNAVCIGSMMAALVGNARNAEAMAFHRRFAAMADDAANSLALRAAVHGDDEEGGRWAIEHAVGRQDRRRALSPETLRAMIRFFGHFGDFEAARNALAALRRSGGAPDGEAVAAMLSGCIRSMSVF